MIDRIAAALEAAFAGPDQSEQAARDAATQKYLEVQDQARVAHQQRIAGCEDRGAANRKPGTQKWS